MMPFRTKHIFEPDFVYDISIIKDVEATRYRELAVIYCIILALGLGLFALYRAPFFLYWSVIFIVCRGLWLASVWRLPTVVGRGAFLWLLGILCLNLTGSTSIIVYLFAHPGQDTLALALLGVIFMGNSILSARTDDVVLCSVYTVFLLGNLSTMPVWLLIQGMALDQWVFVAAVTLLAMVSFVSVVRQTRASRQELRLIRDAEVARRNLQSLGQLTGGVAHDFNNLLTIIKGNLDLHQELGGTDDPEQAALLSEVEAASDRAAALTSQLLVYARNSALSPERIDLAEVITALRPLIERLLPATHRLSIIASPQPVWAEVDEKKLSNVMLNLVTNARQAMDEGGEIAIHIDSRPRPVTGRLASALPDGFYAVIAVQDSGAGIPQDLLHRVVEPYFTTKSMGEGTGLGLSMALGFAEQSGGGLNILSQEGVGTTVELWFPRSAPPATTGADDG